MIVVSATAGVLASTLVTLVDKTVSLIKEGHNNSANIFHNCVEPLYLVIDDAHQNYTRTFVEYEGMIRECVQVEGCAVLFGRVEQDMMLTTHQRIKIATLRLHMTHREVRAFRDCVGAYVRGAARPHQFDEYSNMPRLKLLAELDGILGRLERRQTDAIQSAVRVVRRHAKLLQTRFIAVSTEYERLRAMQMQ